MAIHRRLTAALAAGTVGLLGGCGQDGPATYPVAARVVLDGGNVADLAGSNIDAARTDDPTVRASGTIGADGTVVLETLHGGRIRKGAQEGTYQARVVLADDDREALRRAGKAVAPKYRDFKTSGLTFQVPAAGEVVLKVAPR